MCNGLHSEFVWHRIITPQLTTGTISGMDVLQGRMSISQHVAVFDNTKAVPTFTIQPLPSNREVTESTKRSSDHYFSSQASPRQDGRILPEHARRNGSLCGSSSCWDIFREQVTEFMLLEAKKIHKKVSTVEIKGSAAEKVMITVRERFRHIIRSAAEFAEHRTDVFRNDSQFERILNVRAQIRFLKDSEEAQTELKAQMKKQRIISAAKSRTKKTDEQRAHMKQLVKSIQVAERDEQRIVKANVTALMAIGERRRVNDLVPNYTSLHAPAAFDHPRHAPSGSRSSASFSPFAEHSHQQQKHTLMRKLLLSQRKRVRRIATKDLLTHFSTDSWVRGSELFYRCVLDCFSVPGHDRQAPGGQRQFLASRRSKRISF